MLGIFKIVFVIIATLVGAGFASGKEIYSFFFIYGSKGILGLFISCFIISFIIYKVFRICYKNNLNNYKDFCNYIVRGNSFFADILNNIVNIFLLITYYVMISGFSSLLYQEFGLNKLIGSIIIIFLCYFIFLKNVNGLIKISDYLIPILIIFLLFISIKNLNIISNYNNIFNDLNVQNGGILKSILYACYNCIILIPVLVLFGNTIHNKNIILISIINFILLLILSFSIYNLLLLGNLDIYLLDMPIIEIVKNYGEIYKFIYIILIGISIFTTAISSGTGFLNNFSKNRFKIILFFMSMSAIFLSQVSFTVLVDLLYPILGVMGFFEVLLILFNCNEKL